MTDKFLKKILPLIQKSIEKETDVRRFLEDPELYYQYETITGDLSQKFGLKELQIDQLMGYLYQNYHENPDEYKNIETFTKPKLQKFRIEKREIWTTVENDSHDVDAYLPSMAGYLLIEGEGTKVGKSETEYLQRDDIELSLE